MEEQASFPDDDDHHHPWAVQVRLFRSSRKANAVGDGLVSDAEVVDHPEGSASVVVVVFTQAWRR